MANRNGRIGNGYPTNIRVGTVRARGGGRGVFCVSESGGAVIDRVDIANTGNNAMLIENCYGVSQRPACGTVTGGGEVRICAAHRVPGLIRDLALRNFTLVNNQIMQNPCGGANTDHQQRHPDQLDDQPLLTRPTRARAAPPPGGWAAAPSPGSPRHPRATAPSPGPADVSRCRCRVGVVSADRRRLHGMTADLMIEAEGLVKHFGRDEGAAGRGPRRAPRHRARGARPQRRRQDHRRAHPVHAARPRTPAPPGSAVSTWSRDAERVRQSIGLTGQYASVDEDLTGRQNLELFGTLLELGRAGARRRAAELLDWFDLTDAARPAGQDLLRRHAPTAGPGRQPRRLART